MINRIQFFYNKYGAIINMTGYSSIIYDTQKGVEAFSGLVNFFSTNVKGGKFLNCIRV